MKEIVNDLNKTRVRITRDSVLEVKSRYLGLFRQAMLQLHHSGVVADPGWYDEKEMIYALRSTNSRYTNKLGQVELTPTMLLYATYQAEPDAEGTDGHLSVWDEVNWTSCVGKVSLERQIWLAVTLWGIVNEIDSFYDGMKFPNGRTGNFTHKRLTNIQGVMRNVRFENNEAVAEILATGRAVAHGTYGDLIWKFIYEELRTAKLITEDPSPEGEGLFLKGVTHSQERDLLVLIDNNDMVFEGLYGEWLTRWYVGQVEKKKLTYGNFVKQVRNKWSDQLNEGIAEMLAEYQVIDVSTEGFWVRLDAELRARPNYYMVGQYVFDSGAGELLEDVARLAGACGEFVKSEIVDRGVEDYGTDLTLRGCPVVLEGYGEYYDIYQLNKPLCLWRGKTMFDAFDAELYDTKRNIMFFDDPQTVAEKKSDNGSHGPVYHESV